MNAAPPASERYESPARRRVRFEIVFASIWLGIGLFVLPALIYVVGILLLGPYGEGSGLGRFYADFFGDLVEPSARAWSLALGPLVLISLLRLLFLDIRAHPSDEDVEPEGRSPPAAARGQPRVEPRVSLE
ncbi:MAG: hypothetical protein GX535_09110 [Xanthomonadaceae bacterium]|nr:hypothetical protein [Xanthomonadaceae bacterium]